MVLNWRIPAFILESTMSSEKMPFAVHNTLDFKLRYSTQWIVLFIPYSALNNTKKEISIYVIARIVCGYRDLIMCLLLWWTVLQRN